MSWKEYLNEIRININDTKRLYQLKEEAELDYLLHQNLTRDEYEYIIAYLDGVLDCKVFGGK